MTCSDHDGSIVQVSLGNAGLQVAFKSSSPYRECFICWLLPDTKHGEVDLQKTFIAPAAKKSLPIEEGAPITVSSLALTPPKTRRSIQLSDTTDFK